MSQDKKSPTQQAGQSGAHPSQALLPRPMNPHVGDSRVPPGAYFVVQLPQK